MSLESNKADFESALTEMKETTELLRHCVDEHLMKTLDLVIDEYEGHLQSDIEDAQSTIDDQQEIIDQLNDD